MTKQEAIKLGWVFVGSDEKSSAEKSRFVFTGSINIVLAMISKTESLLTGGK
jgi:hypothetical protein